MFSFFCVHFSRKRHLVCWMKLLEAMTPAFNTCNYKICGKLGSYYSLTPVACQRDIGGSWSVGACVMCVHVHVICYVNWPFSPLQLLHLFVPLPWLSVPWSSWEAAGVTVSVINLTESLLSDAEQNNESQYAQMYNINI